MALKSNKITIDELRRMYEDVCNKYVELFCKKQGIDFDYWIADEVGDISSFACQYFFSISDIIYDLNHKVKKGIILQWQEDSVENEGQSINFPSYAKGLRYSDLKVAPEEGNFGD